MDIYLIDQIMKGRYQPGQRLLDAGAGGGRNLNWFFTQDMELHACDMDAAREELIRHRFPQGDFQWETAALEALPYADGYFDHVLCNAVLHFARDHAHHTLMWQELVRVLRPKGSLFIRTCSDVGLGDKGESLGEGRYRLPDGSERYLMSRPQIDALAESLGLEFLEAVKSTNVDGLRVMTTLVMVKRG